MIKEEKKELQKRGKWEKTLSPTKVCITDNGSQSEKFDWNYDHLKTSQLIDISYSSFDDALDSKTLFYTLWLMTWAARIHLYNLIKNNDLITNINNYDIL